MARSTNNIKYYQKSVDKNSTVFEIAQNNVLVCKIVVPNDFAQKIDFIPYTWMNYYNVRTVAKAVSKKFKRVVVVNGIRKNIEVICTELINNPVAVKSKTKVQKKHVDDDVDIKVIDHNPRHDIDPMILAKALTLICGPKQSLDDAKLKAQQKANEQYIYIKLLDKDSKFICNIYPTISKKEHEKFIKEKIQRDLGKQTLQRIGQFINQKEMGD